MADVQKTPADSGAQRKTVDVPPTVTDQPSGLVPRDGADPELTDEQRHARIGSAGGGPYGPGAPGHTPAGVRRGSTARNGSL